MTPEHRLPLNVRIPPALHERLKAEAEARLVSPSLIVEKALEAFIAKMRPIDVEPYASDAAEQ